MQKDKFKKLLKICIDYGCLTTWDKLFRLPESVVDLIIKYKSKNVVYFVTTLVGNSEVIDEHYVLNAIDFIVRNNVQNYHQLYLVLSRQNVDLKLIELLIKADTPIKRDAIVEILGHAELVNSSNIEQIVNYIKESTDAITLKIMNYITKVYNRDIGQVVEGVYILTLAKDDEELEKVYRVLTDNYGVILGINIYFAKKVINEPDLDYEKLLDDYKKAINKLKSLKEAIKDTKLVHVLAKLNGSNVPEELTSDDMILALYRHKLPEYVSRIV